MYFTEQFTWKNKKMQHLQYMKVLTKIKECTIENIVSSNIHGDT